MGENKVKKRILIITPDFPPEVGGIQKLIFLLANVLKKNYRVEVLTLKSKYYKEFDRIQDYKIIRIRNFLKKFFFILPFLSLPNLIFKRYDLIISGHIKSSLFAIFFGKIKNVPVITYTHALEIMDGRYEKIIRFLLKNSNIVIAVSEYTKKFIENLGVKNVIKIYPPVDPIFLKIKNNKHIKYKLKKDMGYNNKLILLTIARCDKKERYKGIDTVITTLPNLVKKYPNLHYIIVGGGDDLNRLKHLAEGLKIKSYVTFTGFVEHSKLINYYLIADIFIMISKEIRLKKFIKSEGFGIVFAEAQAIGIPVIGGRSGGIPEIVINGKTGFTVNPNDINEISSKIEFLLKNKKIRKEIVKNAKNRIYNEFTIEKYSKNINRIIDSIILRKHS